MKERGMRVRHITLQGLAICLLMAGCGGGGSDSSGNGTAPPVALTVTATPTDRVKTLTAEQSAQVTVPSADTVEVPSSVGLRAGDVIAAAGRAVKLASKLPGNDPARERFQTTTPHLDDLYTSLVFDGRITGADITSSTIVTTGNAAWRAQLAAAVGNSICSPVELSAKVMGLSGQRCTFSFTSERYKSVSLQGNAAVGHELNFQKWDVINNSGSGKISLTFDGDIALQLNSESTSLLPEGDLCTSTRDPVAGARARLFNLAVPSSLPGVSLRIPVCLAFDAKAGITGKIFRLTQQSTIDIAVGGGALPRISSPLPTSSRSEKAAPGDTWVIQNTSSLSNVLIDAEATASLAVEVSLEVAAGLPAAPQLTVVDVGISAAFIGKTSVKGQVSPAVVNIGKTLDSIAADPYYCLDIGLGVDLELTAYLGFPAFRSLLGSSPSATTKLLSKNLWSAPPAKLGKCEFKVGTATTLTSSPNPGTDVTFSAAIQRNDATAGALWSDRNATGSVNVLDRSGNLLCTATILNGTGSCHYVYGGADRTEQVHAQFAGDEYFKPSVSYQHEHQVSRGDKFVTGSATCKMLYAPGGGVYSGNNFQLDFSWSVEAPVGFSIGTRVTYPPYSYSTLDLDCGAWTLRSTPLTTSADGVCTRTEGQPERTVISASGLGGWGETADGSGAPRSIVGWIGVLPAGQSVPLQPYRVAFLSFTCR